VFRSSSS